MNIEIKNIWKKKAVEVLELIEKKEISALEVLTSNMDRIKKVNPEINALVTIDDEKAESLIVRNQSNTTTILKNMPVLIKDISDVKNMKTTYGSRLYQNNIPKKSDIIVTNIENSGGIILGKTNVPEFAAGSHTYNQLFGLTKNPWNTNLSAGGSSGGSAAALATGMAWFATGTDLGGSLRNPASWCGITGLRPTPGLVPHGPSKFPFFSLNVNGPMARNVEDLCIFLDAMVNYNNRDPLAFKKENISYYADLKTSKNEKYLIGYTDDFGIYPCDKEVRDMMSNTIRLVESLGHNVSQDFPDMSEAEDTFQTIRAFMFYSLYGSLLKSDKKLIKEEVIWNINKGRELQLDQLVRAEISRAKIYNNAMNFFDKFDFLIVPSSVVTPFAAQEKWVKKVEGVIFNNYVSWLMIAASISLTGCPSLALATSISKNGAPFGIQIVAAPHEEKKLLRFANILEENVNISDIIPINSNNEPL